MEPQNNAVILIVEDEKSFRDALKIKLVDEGYSVLEAKDGKEGLKIATEHSPDLILLDIIMPKINGYRMLRQLRTQSEYGRTVPVFVLTAFSGQTNSTVQLVTEGEPTYIYEKTHISLSDLLEKIHKCLSAK